MNMKTYNNIKPKFANEFFDAISKSENKAEKFKELGALPPMNFLLSMNFDSTVQFDLPEGMPPYNRNEEDHPDLYAPLASGIRRIMVCLTSDKRSSKWKKEMVFIQLLEGINPIEADILVAAKDRKLTDMYPWLTAEFVKNVYPDYVK